MVFFFGALCKTILVVRYPKHDCLGFGVLHACGEGAQFFGAHLIRVLFHEGRHLARGSLMQLSANCYRSKCCEAYLLDKFVIRSNPRLPK
jgi:hypothetical protein